MDRVWITLVAIGVVTGTASAALFLPANIVLAAAMDGVLVAVVAIGVRQSALISMARSDRRAMMRWLRRGVVGGAAGAIALAGLFRIFGPAALGIVAVLGLTCPQLWAAVADTGGRGKQGRSRSPSHPRWPRPETLGVMSCSDLCALWRESCVELTRAEAFDDVTALSDLRRDVLDELTRRDADGVSRWFRAGAGATLDPDRYLHA